MSTLVFRAVQTPPPLIHRSPRSPFSQDPGEGEWFATIILKFSEYRLMLQFCLGRSEYFIEKVCANSIAGVK